MQPIENYIAAVRTPLLTAIKNDVPSIAKAVIALGMPELDKACEFIATHLQEADEDQKRLNWLIAKGAWVEGSNTDGWRVWHRRPLEKGRTGTRPVTGWAVTYTSPRAALDAAMEIRP